MARRSPQDSRYSVRCCGRCVLQRLAQQSATQVGGQRRAGAHCMHAALRVRRVDARGHVAGRKNVLMRHALQRGAGGDKTALVQRQAAAGQPARCRGADGQHRQVAGQASAIGQLQVVSGNRHTSLFAQRHAQRGQRAPCAPHHRRRRTGQRRAAAEQRHPRSATHRHGAAARPAPSPARSRPHRRRPRPPAAAAPRRAQSAHRAAARRARSAARTGRARPHREWRRGASPARCRWTAARSRARWPSASVTRRVPASSATARLSIKRTPAAAASGASGIAQSADRSGQPAARAPCQNTSAARRA